MVLRDTILRFTIEWLLTADLQVFSLSAMARTLEKSASPAEQFGFPASLEICNMADLTMVIW